MWRHAVNAYHLVTGQVLDYLVLGALRGGGQLVEVGWTADAGAPGNVRYALAVSGSPAPTIGNLLGGTSLLQRSNDTSGVFPVPTLRLTLSADQYYRLVLPLSVRLDAGGQYVIIGIAPGTADLDVHTLAWALEVGGPGAAGFKRPMVDGQGLGVENGLER